MIRHRSRLSKTLLCFRLALILRDPKAVAPLALTILALAPTLLLPLLLLALTLLELVLVLLLWAVGGSMWARVLVTLDRTLQSSAEKPPHIIIIIIIIIIINPAHI